jgi:hypothetical protein
MSWKQLEKKKTRDIKTGSDSETPRPMQTLDWNSTTNYLLFKHHLLEGSQAENILQVVDDIVALHATSEVTPYLSLFARVRDFEKKHLDQELYIRRNLIRLEAMRGTLFVVSTDLAPTLYQATKTPKPHRLKRLQRWGIYESEYKRLSKELYNILRKGGKTLSEIKRALSKDMVRSLQLRVGKAHYKGTNINIVLGSLIRDGIVVSEKDAATLSKPDTRGNRYMLFEEAYPNLDLDSVSREEAKASLVQRYIRSYGPVTGEDITWWTGFTKAELQRALTTIEDQLCLVNISGLDRDYWMLKTDHIKCRKLKPLKGKSVILLPYEDPYTKGYKTRDRFVDADYERKAYPGGEVQPTILLNGKIIGTWTRSLRNSRRVQLIFFEKPELGVESEAAKKTKAMARLISECKPEVQVKVES